MSLEKLREEGLKWVEANRSKRFSGVTKLLTDLYPDNAHFIYELLQNAEDARDKNVQNSSGASVVRFTLTDDALEFEHNGEGLFTLDDVGRITGIGDSAKRDDPTSIGKFGIGFKAVFAYTNTPEIHSGEFHFRIHDLVVPETEGVTRPRMSERETRFIFPFDNPKKPPMQAVAEIGQGLRALGDNTLLFLSHILKIEYLFPDGSFGSLERIDHEGGHIEIRASHPGGDEAVSHWLRFQKDVDVVDEEDGKAKTCRIAIAYALEMDERKKKGQDWKVVPIAHGQVSIYFPAVAAVSNLRFHLHAPFASTVARDTVRDCDANRKLRDQLCNLAVESLFAIRNQDMLSVGFLAVLPNPADNLPTFYEPIRKAIVTACQNESLTPTKNGKHAPATKLYRGPADIARVLDDEGLAFLLGGDHVPPLWVANPTPAGQREKGFLDSLKLKEWGWGALTKAISWLHGEDQKRVETWLEKKDDGWLFRFYALLGDACGPPHHAFVYVNNLRIVRVESDNGDKHVKPEKAFFPPVEGIHPPLGIYFVKPAVYSTGRAEAQKKSAVSFLEHIEVHPFDAKAAINLKLTGYQEPHLEGSSYYNDLEQFITYWKANPSDIGIFRKHAFLRGISPDGSLHWCKPEQLCMDSPYFETGLGELVKVHEKHILCDSYLNQLSASILKIFVSFLKAIRVMYRLEVVRQSTWLRGRTEKLHFDYRGRVRERNRTDEDWSIPKLDQYLKVKTIASSRLIWNALLEADGKTAIAKYAPNGKFDPRSDDSWLILELKKHAWIPDGSGEFRKAQDMTKDELRTDFPYDDRNGLLTAICFGEHAKKRSNEYQARNAAAKIMGFASADEAEELAKLICEAGITSGELRSLISQRRHSPQPEEAVPNPERRRKGVLERRENTPPRESITRERTIQPGAKPETLEAKAYLRAKYKNADRQLICQCCQTEMPFKINGEHYFEAIQCLRGLDHHYFENRLALCPLCAAMYQYARETEDTEMRRRIIDHNSPDTAPYVEVPVQLAGRSFALHFVGTHWFDLKTILSN